MKLSKEIKDKILTEYTTWFESLYGSTSKEERRALGAVFTPPEITIQMIERLDTLKENILDPCCGAGNLLAGCIIAGADPNKIYGNEFEERFVKVAKDRLNKLGVPENHIHQGDATDKRCIELKSFTDDYKWPIEEKKKFKKIELW